MVGTSLVIQYLIAWIDTLNVCQTFKGTMVLEKKILTIYIQHYKQDLK